MTTPGRAPEPRRELNLFDATNLVIGSIIGADIYIVAALGAGLLGPALLTVWVAGAVITAMVAVPFAQCAAISPRVGGAYAYTRDALGALPGFVVGWAMYVTEWAAVAVLPIAFVMYLGYLFGDFDPWLAAIVKAALIGSVTTLCVLRAKVGATANDILTVAKLAPLLLLVLFGLALVVRDPSASYAHVVPFAPFGWHNFPGALVLVYFAYTGVELVAVPAQEVKDPRHTFPRSLFLGVAIVSFFHIMVNAVVVAITPCAVLDSTPTPLAITAETIFSSFHLPPVLGGALMSVGALASICGALVAIVFSVSRLSYAMGRDGVFPAFFARQHPRFATPHLGLLFLGATTLAATLIGGLADLITTSVFSAGLVYLITSLAAWRLMSRGSFAVPRLLSSRHASLLGALSGLLLMAVAFTSVGPFGLALILLSVPLHFVFRRR